MPLPVTVATRAANMLIRMQVTQTSRVKKCAPRAVRGGSWNNNARRARSAYRNANHPGNANHNLGFRLSLSSMARAPWMRRAAWTRPRVLPTMVCAVAENCKAPKVLVDAALPLPRRTLLGLPTLVEIT